MTILQQMGAHFNTGRREFFGTCSGTCSGARDAEGMDGCFLKVSCVADRGTGE